MHKQIDNDLETVIIQWPEGCFNGERWGGGGAGGRGGLNLETVAKSQELNIKQPYSQHLGSYFRWTPTSWAFRTFILCSSGYMELDQDQSDATLHATEM